MLINLKNRSQELQRIRLIPKSPESIVSTGLEAENPTFRIDSDNILSVCLSPGDPCEGALSYADTGGVWGNFIVNINGVDYTNPWSGPITDLLHIDNSMGELHFKWINISSELLQVEIRNANIYESDYGWAENNNPTSVVDFDQKTIKFCLINEDTDCRNATSRIRFMDYADIRESGAEVTVVVGNEVITERIARGDYGISTDFNEKFGEYLTSEIFVLGEEGSEADFVQFTLRDGLDSNVKVKFKIGWDYPQYAMEESSYTPEGEMNGTSKILGDTLTFCLSEDLACRSSAPYTINTSQTIYKLDPSKEYYMYLEDSLGDIVQLDVNNLIELDNNEYAFTVDSLPSPYGFYNEVQSNVELRPYTCKESNYQGDFYVRQLVTSWDNHHVVGSFYVSINGVKEYLPDSQRSFQHKGTATTLRDLLTPYYQNIVAFLQSHGVNAVYDTNMWGSYNTGGIKVTMNEEQQNTIQFGTETGYDLLFDGYLQSTCILFQTFDEIDNGPATVTIHPISNGDPGKNVYTLLSSYVPPEPDRANILTLIGLPENKQLTSCYNEMPS